MLLTSPVCAAQAAQARRQRSVLRAAATAGPARTVADYARVETESEGGDLVLQTAVVRLEAPFSWERLLQPRAYCDLVAAVHIADTAYFERLQRELDGGYDEVLYELVADTAKTPPAERCLKV